MNWYDIEPKDALDIDFRTRPDLNPPVNEMGEVRPWPWDPQQLTGAPMWQYHCRYCGAMCMAGMPHIDYGIRPCPVCMEMVDFWDMHHAVACGLINEPEGEDGQF